MLLNSVLFMIFYLIDHSLGYKCTVDETMFAFFNHCGPILLIALYVVLISNNRPGRGVFE